MRGKFAEAEAKPHGHLHELDKHPTESARLLCSLASAASEQWNLASVGMDEIFTFVRFLEAIQQFSSYCKCSKYH